MKTQHGLTSSKDGVGNPGVLIETAPEVLGLKYDAVMKKVCRFCHKPCGSPDPVRPTYTRSWNKPGMSGLCCAYCGVAKWKNFPFTEAADLETLLKSNSEEREKFMQFVENVIDHYKAGNKSIRYMDSAKESLDKEKTVEMKSGVKGKAILWSSYKAKWDD